MPRMFAFGGVKVIVLPQLEHWQAFPASLHSSQCELSALWGWINDGPYHNRGWCAVLVCTQGGNHRQLGRSGRAARPQHSGLAAKRGRVLGNDGRTGD